MFCNVLHQKELCISFLEELSPSLLLRRVFCCCCCSLSSAVVVVAAAAAATVCCLSVCPHLPQFVPAPFVFSRVLLPTSRAHYFSILLAAFRSFSHSLPHTHPILFLPLLFAASYPSLLLLLVFFGCCCCFISLIVVVVVGLLRLLLLLRLVSPVFSKLSLFEAFVFVDQVPDPALEYIDQELCM